MRTDLIDIDDIPEGNQLISLLGNGLYVYYLKICESIVSLLSPKIERWAKGGRRGKYYHGYLIDKKAILVDLFLISEINLRQVTCSFHLQKKNFLKIFKKKAFFNAPGKAAIDSCIRLHELYPRGYTLEFRLKNNDDEIVEDVIHVIEILGDS